jgi:hypothetical protein
MKEILFLFFLASYSIASATTHYVSTNGSDNNPGTISQPFVTWQKGFSTIKAGDTLYIRGGTYSPIGTFINSKYCGVAINNHDGTAENPIVVMNYPEEIPVIDCQNITNATVKGGIYLLYSSYWHIKGLTVTGVNQDISGNGGGGIMLNNSDNITVEQCAAHHIGGTGFHVAFNCNNILLLNCDSYSNSDPHSSDAYGGADGFVIAQITGVNGNNSLRGCRAWYNSDDGFDFFNNESHVNLDNCWSFYNGYIPDTFLKGGDGNGFKLGETSLDHGNTIVRTVTNSIAYNNRTSGFHQNEAPAAMALYNNIAYLNGGQGFWFGIYDKIHLIKNNISFKNASNCFLSSSSIVSNNTFLKDNTANPALPLTETDFVSLDGTQLTWARKADGSLPDITFMHLASGSVLIDAGADVGQSFGGMAPDIGAFENITGEVHLNQLPVVSISSPVKGISITYPATVTIDIEANDPDGNITKVELFNGGIKLGERTTAPYSFTLKDLPEGSYSLIAVATDNLKATTTSSSLDLEVKSTYNENREYFNLFPNPNDGRFSLNFTTTLEAENYTVTIVDLIGKTVYQQELSNDEAIKQFDLSHLKSGIYVLLISSNQILLTQKFIKG